MPDWSVAIDRERCIGSGVCVGYAPDTFTQDAEAKAVALVPVGELAAAEIAVEGCPTGALTIIYTDGLER